MYCSTPGFPLHHLLKVCSNSCPLSQWHHPAISSSVVPYSSCLQSLSIRVFSCESAFLIRWPKYWSFSISPSNEYSGLISFRIDWLDLLAVQGTLKSLLQHYSLKASILCCSAFFMVQLSHPYHISSSKEGVEEKLEKWVIPKVNNEVISNQPVTFLSGK